MQMQQIATKILSCATMALAFTLSAHALTNQTYISATGSDSGTCSSADPCATITYALTQTKPGGEIVIATSGTYAPATVTQAVSVIAASSVDASILTTTAGANALTIDTTGNVSINGITLRGGGTGNDGILVTKVGVLRLNNMTIQHFAENGIEFLSPSSEMAAYNSSLLDNGHDGLRVDASGAHVYVEGSAFDKNVYAGGDSVEGKLTISDSSAHFNTIGFFANGGSVTLYNDRAIFNTTGFQAHDGGNLRFANCLLSDNTNAWQITTGGALYGSSPGTTLAAPGQTKSGTLSVPVTLN
jgi:uncharacterized transporter YbjL